MGTAHTCKDDESGETHECFCEVGKDHPASLHRAMIRERRYLAQVAEQRDGA